MPQLVPFYFINQITFAFLLLVVIVYILSRNILPQIMRLFVARTYLARTFISRSVGYPVKSLPMHNVSALNKDFFNANVLKKDFFTYGVSLVFIVHFILICIQFSFMIAHNSLNSSFTILEYIILFLAYQFLNKYRMSLVDLHYFCLDSDIPLDSSARWVKLWEFFKARLTASRPLLNLIFSGAIIPMLRTIYIVISRGMPHSNFSETLSSCFAALWYPMADKHYIFVGLCILVFFVKFYKAVTNSIKKDKERFKYK